MTNDLLDYTIQRVKAKDPEYKKVRAYIMENAQLEETVLYEKLKDDGKPHFPKSQTFHLCKRGMPTPLMVTPGLCANRCRTVFKTF
jgi:hypothetical protein